MVSRLNIARESQKSTTDSACRTSFPTESSRPSYGPLDPTIIPQIPAQGFLAAVACSCAAGHVVENSCSAWPLNGAERMQSSTKQPPCDQCYQRRVRCRGSPGHPCSACIVSSLTCTRERVRGKRGPKKKTLCHADASHGSRVHSDGQSTPTLASVAQDRVDSDSGDPPRSGLLGLTTVDEQALGADSNPHAESLHGRAQIQVAHRTSQFVTVNELAGVILEDNGLDAMRTDSDWLRGVRNASIASQPAFSINTPSLTTPSTPMPEKRSDENDAIATHKVGAPTPSSSTLTYLVPEASIALDGTALALAAGLPPRYGPEITSCVETYFARLYHVLPILHEGLFRRLLACPAQLSPSQRSLFLAVCAVTKLRNCHEPDKAQVREARELGCLFLEQHLRLQCDIDCREEKSASTITTTFLVHVAYASLNKQKSARLYLREAICKAMDLGFHRDDGCRDQDDIETICAQRTLALLFVTERATAILDSSDVLLLREPPYLPDIYFDEYDHKALRGFQCLFALFKLLDAEIIQTWCSGTLPRGHDTQTARDKICSVQHHLSATSFCDEGLSHFQRADIQVTQQWLRLIFWQISMRLGFLSNWSEEPALSYNYPIELGKDLCVVLHSLPETSLRAHHFSIVSGSLIPSL